MNQIFSLTKTGQLRRESFCLFGDNIEGSNLKMRLCSHNELSSEKWLHNKEGLIVNKESGNLFIIYYKLLSFFTKTLIIKDFVLI
jgi:hypothetical protein